MSGWKEAYALVPASTEIFMGETEAQREVVTHPGSLPWVEEQEAQQLLSRPRSWA